MDQEKKFPIIIFTAMNKVGLLFVQVLIFFRSKKLPVRG